MSRSAGGLWSEASEPIVWRDRGPAQNFPSRGLLAPAHGPADVPLSSVASPLAPFSHRAESIEGSVAVRIGRRQIKVENRLLCKGGRGRRSARRARSAHVALGSVAQVVSRGKQSPDVLPRDFKPIWATQAQRPRPRPRPPARLPAQRRPGGPELRPGPRRRRLPP
jgi:hypothetical protein